MTDESKGRQEKTSEKREASGAIARHGAPEKPDRGSAEGKRTGSAGTRKGGVDMRGGASAGQQEVAPDYDSAGADDYYESNIAPLLEEMTTLAQGSYLTYYYYGYCDHLKHLNQFLPFQVKLS